MRSDPGGIARGAVCSSLPATARERGPHVNKERLENDQVVACWRGCRSIAFQGIDMEHMAQVPASDLFNHIRALATSAAVQSSLLIGKVDLHGNAALV